MLLRRAALWMVVPVKILPRVSLLRNQVIVAAYPRQTRRTRRTQKAMKAPRQPQSSKVGVARVGGAGVGMGVGEGVRVVKHSDYRDDTSQSIGSR